jgi:hypothetical protein
MIVPVYSLTVCAYSLSLLASEAAALITFGSAVGAITVTAISAIFHSLSLSSLSFSLSLTLSLSLSLSLSLLASEAAALITFGSAVSAITVAAVSANHFDISPKNAGTIFGIGNTAGCIGS